MHPRVSVDNVCFPGVKLATDIERWRALKPPLVGTHVMKMREEGWDASVALLRDCGFKFSTMCTPFVLGPFLDNADKVHEAQQELLRTIAAAKAIDSPTIYMSSGGRGSLDWHGAAKNFAQAVAPCVAEARKAGVELSLEPTPTVYADLHIAHTLRDTLTLAELSDMGLCIDIFHCWTEEDLRQTIQRAGKRIKLVQVSDYTYGDRSFPCRSVVGDGVIPLERIMGWILETGYKGAFDLELIGPRIDKEGHVEAVRRTCDRLSEMLTRLGA